MACFRYFGQSNSLFWAAREELFNVQGTIASEVVKRQRFTEGFKAEALQMLLDSHTVVSVCERLGLSWPNLLYAWRQWLVERGGSTNMGLEA
jgi:transposase-like protein